MADANEVDEATKVDEDPKLNSSLGEDAPQSDIAPSMILSDVEEEEHDDESEDEGESEEDEDEEEQEDEEGEENGESEEEGEKEKVNDGGSAIVVVNGEGANTDKEQNKANVDKKDENKAGETKNGEELGENLKRNEKRVRVRNRNKKKDAQKASVVEDKPESSSKKKVSKRVESMGMVFMCSSKTKSDCFRYKVLGLPGNKKDQVAKIYKGMRLFLFDVDLRLMYGIFKAAAPGGYNLEPKAFNSEFPAQVRFTVLEDCLPVAEEKFKEVLKKNYYTRNKFEGLLKGDQVKDLCKLFVGARAKAPAKSPRSRAVENRRVRGGESRRIRADDAHLSRPREKRKRRPREEERRPRHEERRPHSPPRREKRRHTDYERSPVRYEREAPVRYEREAPVRYEREAPVRYEREPPVLYEREAPVARYLPPPLASPVRYYERPLDMAPYRAPPEHHAYRVIDVDLSRDRERERDSYQVYSREAPAYYTLPAEYIVPRDYRPPVVPAAEYRLSGGSSSLASYRDVGLATTDYRSSAPSLSEYHSRTHYKY